MIPNQQQGFRVIASGICLFKGTGNQTTERLDMRIFSANENIGETTAEVSISIGRYAPAFGKSVPASTGIGHSVCFGLMKESYHTGGT